MSSERAREAYLERRRRQEAAERTAEALARAHNRPEDSSPSIRKLLGYDQPARRPLRWEPRFDLYAGGPAFTTDVAVGYADEPPPRPRRGDAEGYGLSPFEESPGARADALRAIEEGE